MLPTCPLDDGLSLLCFVYRCVAHRIVKLLRPYTTFRHMGLYGQTVIFFGVHCTYSLQDSHLNSVCAPRVCALHGKHRVPLPKRPRQCIPVYEADGVPKPGPDPGTHDAEKMYVCSSDVRSDGEFEERRCAGQAWSEAQ